MNTLTLEHNKCTFAYVDSGIPLINPTSYVTVFVVHGMGFTVDIFKKVMDIGHESGVRFVAIVRRGYNGTTPYSENEATAATTGTDDEKEAFISQRGVELASFIDLFIRSNNLPPISDDGKRGGIALLGWSGGITFTLSAIANADKLSTEAQELLTRYMRSHILEEPPSVCLGLPLPPKLWSPLIDTSIPEETRTPMYMNWITSYFDHGDLSTKDINELSYFVPSIARAPSIYNMNTEEQKKMITDASIGFEATFMFVTQPQAYHVYWKACFDRSIKNIFPRMKTTVIVGDKTCSFPLNGLFSIQEDNEKNGGDIQFVILEGVNHFMQWDDPEKTYKAFVDAF